jgi:hypothetical protein
MKKTTILLIALIALILAGCSSSSAAPSPVETNDFDNTIIDTDYTAPTDQGGNAFPGEYDDPADDVPQGIEDFTYSDEVTFEDFAFFTDYMYYGPPEDAYYATLSHAVGSWKYNLLFRYDSSSLYYDELGHADVSIDYDKDTLIIVLHPELGNDGYESWPMTDADAGYEPYEGGFDENDNLLLYGNDAVILVDRYYDSSGREYFISEIWISEEESGYLLLTRGQN